MGRASPGRGDVPSAPSMRVAITRVETHVGALRGAVPAQANHWSEPASLPPGLLWLRGLGRSVHLQAHSWREGAPGDARVEPRGPNANPTGPSTAQHSGPRVGDCAQCHPESPQGGRAAESLRGCGEGGKQGLKRCRGGAHSPAELPPGCVTGARGPLGRDRLSFLCPRRPTARSTFCPTPAVISDPKQTCEE